MIIDWSANQAAHASYGTALVWFTVGEAVAVVSVVPSGGWIGLDEIAARRRRDEENENQASEAGDRREGESPILSGDAELRLLLSALEADVGDRLDRQIQATIVARRRIEEELIVIMAINMM